MGSVIAVVSGKGGTGKTSVCAGVAIALAESGEKVLCIDCDVGLRNLDISLALSDSGSLSFQDICSGAYRLEQTASHPAYPSLFFLTAPVSGSADAVDQEAFADLLRQAKVMFDYVLLDAPAGIDAGFDLAARYVDRIVMVTGPDPAAVRDAARAAELLEETRERGGRGKMGIVNIGLICPAFEAGAVITLKDLKEKNLIAPDAGRVKVLASGSIDRPLTVKADAFSVQAIKMMTVTGGHAVRLMGGDR